jgi:hypothetical protein
MSVPTSISQLNVTASLNGPVGSEPIGNNLAPYLQSHAAFIAQVANGTGITMSKALSMNSYQINNVAAGAAATDAVNLTQLRNYLPIGAVMLWAGTAANIASSWGSNWQLCDGTNGTPDLRNKFVIGAGGAYAPGATGGSTSVTLSVANMPVHNHGVYDPGHTHGVADPGHAHSVYDPGHSHNFTVIAHNSDSAGSSSITGGGYNSPNDGSYSGTTDSAGTGIGIYGAGTGIGIYGAATGISINNAGSGAAFTVIPPYYALCYVMKVANG